MGIWLGPLSRRRRVEGNERVRSRGGSGARCYCQGRRGRERCRVSEGCGGGDCRGRRGEGRIWGGSDTRRSVVKEDSRVEEKNASMVEAKGEEAKRRIRK